MSELERLRQQARLANRLGDGAMAARSRLGSACTTRTPRRRKTTRRDIDGTNSVPGPRHALDWPSLKEEMAR